MRIYANREENTVCIYFRALFGLAQEMLLIWLTAKQSKRQPKPPDVVGTAALGTF